jgi:hypothetical protein
MLDPPRDADGKLTLSSGDVLLGFYVRPRAHYFGKEGSTDRERPTK